MQKTSRLRLAALSAVFLCATLTACGGGDELGTPEPPAPAPPAAAPAFVYIYEADVIRVCQVDGTSAPSRCVDAKASPGMDITPTLGMAVGGDHAYLTINDSPFSSALVHCTVGADAPLSGCAPTAVEGGMGALQWVTLRGSTLDVGGSDSPRVRRCVVKPDGSLEPCADGGISDSVADVVRDLQILGKTAYLLLTTIAAPEEAISVCDVTVGGSLSGCADADVPGLGGASSLTAHGKHLYIANSGENNVIRCVIADDGSLDDCRDSGAQGLAKPSKVAIRDSIGYITNDDISGGLTRCMVGSDGLLGNCVSVPDMGRHVSGIVFRQ